MWVGTQKNGVYHHVGDVFEPLKKIPRAGIWDIAEDAEGGLWCSVDRQGVWAEERLYCLEGGDLRSFGREDGMLADNIWCIFEDSGGQVWFGGLQGLNHYDGTFIHFNTKTNLHKTNI